MRWWEYIGLYLIFSAVFGLPVVAMIFYRDKRWLDRNPDRAKEIAEAHEKQDLYEEQEREQRRKRGH